MPPGKRHPQEFCIKACEMYAQGMSVLDIAKELKLPDTTITRWKGRKYPEDWEQKREKRRQAAAEILETKALESYSQTRIRHQKMLSVAINRMARRVSQAKDDELTPNQAADHLPRLIETEREIYMEPEELIRIKNRAFGQIGMGVGANVNPQTGNAQIMAFLTNSFNAIHSKDPQGKVIEGTTSDGTNDDKSTAETEPDAGTDPRRP